MNTDKKIELINSCYDSLFTILELIEICHTYVTHIKNDDNLENIIDEIEYSQWRLQIARYGLKQEISVPRSPG